MSGRAEEEGVRVGAAEEEGAPGPDDRPGGSGGAGPPEPHGDLEAVGREFEAALGAIAAELTSAAEAYAGSLSAVLGDPRAAGESGAEAADGAQAPGPDGPPRTVVQDGEALRVRGRRLAELLSDSGYSATERTRAEVLAVLDEDLAAVGSDLPSEVEVDRAEGRTSRASTPPAVRPGWPARASHGAWRLTFGRGSPRRVPVAPLARFYARAELPRRLSGPLGNLLRLRAATLHALDRAFAADLDGYAARNLADPERPEADPPPRASAELLETARAQAAATVEAFRTEVGRVVDEVAGEFRAALRAEPVRVDDDRTATIAGKASRRLAETASRWAEYEAAREAMLRTRVAGAEGISRMAEAVAAFARSVEGSLDALLVDALERLARELDAEATVLTGGPDAPGLAAIRERVDAHFEAHGKPAFTTLPGEVRDALADFLRAVEAVPDSVPEQALVVAVEDGPVPPDPPDPDGTEVPLRRRFEGSCRGEVTRVAERGIAEAVEVTHRLGGEIRRLWQAISFHIKVSAGARTDEFDDQGPAARTGGALARSAAQLRELREEGTAALRPPVERVRRTVTREASEILEGLRRPDGFGLRSEILEDEAAARVRLELGRAGRLLAAGWDELRRRWRPVREGAAKVVRWGGRRLGYEVEARERLFESLDRSRLEHAFHESIPAFYRRLFSVEVVEPEWTELLVPREAELATVDRAWKRWQAGHDARLAVVGEKGSGKTTLVEVALDRFVTDDVVIRHFVPGRAVWEVEVLAPELARAMDRDPELGLHALAEDLRSGPYTVVLVEDAHHLFVRAPGGFEALHAFLALVASTRDQVFWILTIDEYAWRYLDRAVGIQRHFPYVVNTTRLPPDKLEEAVLSRHHISGYALEIRVGEEGEDEAGPVARIRRRLPPWLGGVRPDESARRESARSRYFRRLSDICEGNVVLGLFYWLASVEAVEGHTVVVGMPQMLDVAYLEELPLASLHTAAAVMMHGGLSEEAHARVMNVPESESRLHLAAMTDANLLFRSEGEYKINKILYRPFAQLLRTKNIL